MIKDVKRWEEWEARLVASETPDYWRNLKLYESMWEYARFLGVLPLKNPLEGIAEKIEFARRMNVPTDD